MASKRVYPIEWGSTSPSAHRARVEQSCDDPSEVASPRARLSQGVALDDGQRHPRALSEEKVEVVMQNRVDEDEEMDSPQDEVI